MKAKAVYSAVDSAAQSAVHSTVRSAVYSAEQPQYITAAVVKAVRGVQWLKQYTQQYIRNILSQQ